MRPLRIVQLLKGFYIGGTEVQAIELCRGLSRRHVVKAAVLDKIGAFLPEVEALDLGLPEFPLGGSFLSPNTARQIVRLSRYLKEIDADVLHAQDFYSTLLGVPAAKLSGVKVVVSRLDLVHWHGKPRALALAGLTRMADHVIANAEAVKRYCIENEQLPPGKITVVRNGIDLSRFDERALRPAGPLPPSDGVLNVAHVANLVHPVKRQEDSISALRRAKELGAKVRLVLVGDGGRRSFLEAHARGLGLRDDVSFLSYRTDVPAILARCHIGVLASTHEGLSNAVMEGMASRLPMVVTDVGGNPELVKHGERGFVVPPRSPEELGARIAELARRPAEARMMGEKGRAFVEQELTLEKLVAGHEQVYEGCFGASEPTGTSPLRAGPLPLRRAG